MAIQPVAKDGPLLVIGAGLGRTGTNSLKKALEILYGQPCYHMFELIEHHKEHSYRWVSIDEDIDRSTNGKVDAGKVKELFKGYRCAVDFPVCAYYRQLMETYPEAKVVLTVREPHVWVQSIRATILPGKLNNDGWIEHLVRSYFDGSGYRAMEQRMWKRVFGQDVDVQDDEMLAKRSQLWAESVKQNVPADLLLVFSVKEGWEPLCQFLQLPIPNEPFPRVNERQELASELAKFKRITRTIRWGIAVIGGLTLGLIMYRLQHHFSFSTFGFPRR